MSTKIALLLWLICSGLSIGFSEPDCTANGTLVGCTTACPETCKTKNTNQPCYLACGGPCKCKEGYIIDTSIPTCVLRADRPAGIVQSQTEEENVFNFPNFSPYWQ